MYRILTYLGDKETLWIRCKTVVQQKKWIRDRVILTMVLIL